MEKSHNKFLQGRITRQGDPCSHYREWICSVLAVIQLYVAGDETPKVCPSFFMNGHTFGQEDCRYSTVSGPAYKSYRKSLWNFCIHTQVYLPVEVYC